VFCVDFEMPRSSSVAPRATLQTSTSVVRTSQKRLSSSRPVMFAESPKASVEPSVAALSVKKNDMDEVPDSQPPDSQGEYFELLLKYCNKK